MEGDSRPATRSRSPGDGGPIGKGIVNYSAAELRRIKGMKTAEVRELLPRATEEAVHRDYFVARVGFDRQPSFERAGARLDVRRSVYGPKADART